MIEVSERSSRAAIGPCSSEAMPSHLTSLESPVHYRLESPEGNRCGQFKGPCLINSFALSIFPPE